MRVAIVCDWLLGTGGAERVVLELHHMFPEAPIYTSQYNSNPKIWFGDKWFEDADIRTAWLQKLPKSLKKFLPVLRAWTFSRLNFSDYDLVISSSGAEAKFIKVRGGATHITYCHAPTHYYWSRYEEYFKHPGFGRLDPLARLGLRLLVGPMRYWDYKAAQRPDYLIANSNYTKEQIKKYYDREATVIHPPVDIDRFRDISRTKKAAVQGAGEDRKGDVYTNTLTAGRSSQRSNVALSTSGVASSAGQQAGAVRVRRGFVTAGRQVPYKKINLAVKAATKLNVPLVVIGRGPDHAKLKRLAGRSVTFLTNVSDEEMPEKLAQAEAFVFPGIDDFGIVAVEAMAAGTPVIACGVGGALDYVNKTTGLLFKEQTAESLAKTMQEFSKLSFNHSQIAEQAGKFSPLSFRQKMNDFISKIAS